MTETQRLLCSSGGSVLLTAGFLLQLFGAASRGPSFWINASCLGVFALVMGLWIGLLIAHVVPR